MLIKSINTTSFKGTIIDSHAHLGTWKKDNFQPASLNNIAQDTFEIAINGKTQTDEIECFLISNLSCFDKKNGQFVQDEITGNKELLEICKNNPKFKAELACEPNHGNAENIENLLKDRGNEVYALKFHPQESNLAADDAKYEKYMQLAQKYKKPCVFHSDRIDTHSSPYKIYELAKKTPNVPVVLYHMSMASGDVVKDLPVDQIQAKGLEQVAATVYSGGEDYKNYVWEYRDRWNQDGIDVVKKAIDNKDANLYLEISWTKPETVVNAIKKVGEDRVLFGTDAPFDDRGKYIQYVTDVKTAIKQEFGDKADGIINKVFFQNSNNLFFDGKLHMSVGKAGKAASSSIKESTSSSVLKSKGKAFPIALSIVAVVGLGAFLFNKKNKETSLVKS
jgi:predicted TIM-barrel fold metal-dependent hydrolase